MWYTWGIVIRILMAVMVVIAVLALLHLASGRSFAHEWYDKSCCSDNDCVPVDRIELGDGYRIYHTKKFSPMSLTDEEFRERRRGRWKFDIKNSKDSNIHICVDEDSYETTHDSENEGYDNVTPEIPEAVLICLYLPGVS